MRQHVLRIALVGSIALTPLHAASQTVQRPSPPSSAQPRVLAAMTNADVIKLVKAGLGDDLIISAIENAHRVAFDCSADGLVILKTAGVGESVMRVMLDPKSKTVSKPQPPVPPTAVAVAPPMPQKTTRPSGSALTARDAGIYLQVSGSSQDAIPLEPTVFSQAKGNALGTMMTWGLAKTKWRAVVRSPRANVRTTEQQPVFYFHFENKGSGLSNSGGFAGWLSGASSPNEFVLVQMYEKRDSRELIVGESNAFSTSNGTRSEDTVPLKVERLGPGEYRVTPTEPLGGGEFCFFYSAGVTAISGGAVGKLFDFGVDSERTNR